MTEDRRRYLVWSNEHGRWWCPGQRGYTCIISKAGRYSLADAARICVNANQYREPTEEPNEVFVLAPEELPVSEE